MARHHMTDKYSSEQGDQQRHLTSDALRHAQAVCAFATGVLGAQQAAQDHHIRIFAMAHGVRMLRYAQAVCKLIESGLADPAGAVSRVLLEQAWVIQALHKNPENFDVLMTEGLAEGRKALEGLARLQPEHRSAELTVERLTSEIAKLPASSAFVPHNWAGRADSKSVYLTLYRTLSTFAHGGPTGTLDYLRWLDEEGGGVRIDGNAASVHSSEMLTVASALMLDVIDIVCDQRLSASQIADAARLTAELQLLVERTNQARSSEVP